MRPVLPGALHGTNTNIAKGISIWVGYFRVLGLGGSEEGHFFQSPQDQSVNILKLLSEGLEKLTLKGSYFLRKFLGLLLYCTMDSRVKGCKVLVAEGQQRMSVSEAMSPFC